MKKTVIALVALALVVAVVQGVYAQGDAIPRPPVKTYSTAASGEPPLRPMMRPTSPSMRQCTAMLLVLPPGAVLEMRAEQLQIANEQKAKIKEALGKAEKTLQPLREESAKKAKALRDALYTPGIDASALRALTDAALKAESDIVNAELAAWNDLRKILTAEQLKKLGETAMGGPGMMPPPPVPIRPSENTPPPPPPAR